MRKTYLLERGVPQGLEDLQRHCLVTYVRDLIFADQLNFMPDLYGPAYSRLECSTAVGQLEAVRGRADIGILHDYAAHRDEQLQIVLPGTVFERSCTAQMFQSQRYSTGVNLTSNGHHQRVSVSVVACPRNQTASP